MDILHAVVGTTILDKLTIIVTPRMIDEREGIALMTITVVTKMTAGTVSPVVMTKSAATRKTVAVIMVFVETIIVAAMRIASITISTAFVRIFRKK